jgi:hypothetical protein
MEKKMKAKFFHLILVLAIAVSMAGCSSGAAQTQSPANQPAANQPAASSELTLVSTFAFTDQWGRYYVVGEIQNNTSTAITSIGLTLELKDASGNSLLKDESGNSLASIPFSPLLYTLAPGQSAPFSYSYDASAGAPATYNVTIAGQAPSQATLADIKVEKDELIDNGNGSFHLSGELVNTGSHWAKINALAGSGLDSNNQVMTTDWSSTYTTLLAPTGDAAGRDRTPFSIEFPVPGTAVVTKWAVYTDAGITDAPTDYSLAVDIANTYFDSYNSYHLIGTLTNHSSVKLHTMIVGGLYAGDGTTLDASWSFIPVIIEPDASIPFDMASFSSVNWNAKQASRVSSFTVRFDPWATYTPSWEVVALGSTGDQVSKDGATWTFSGSILNNSGRSLSGETIIIAVRDAQGKLIGTTYSYVSPDGDAIAGGQTTFYEVSLYLDPTADTTGYTFQTIVQGDVK